MGWNPGLPGFHHENARRKFGVHLRSVWNLHYGSLRVMTVVDENLAAQKARRAENGL